MISHGIPRLPWFKMGADLFHFDNNIYIYKLVVDYYSKFIEIAYLSSGFSSSLVILQLKSMFFRFRIPSILVTDNGPPFSFKDFMEFNSD